MAREMQLRLVYSLLKPAARCAVRFGIPIRTLTELLRLASYEVLSEEGFDVTAIAKRFGQTPRHVRSLRQKYDGDFFAAEKEVGLTRAVEDSIAQHPSKHRDLIKRFSAVGSNEVDVALQELREAGRIELDEQDRWNISKRYVVLTSEKFHHRIDALNHHLDLVYRAVIQRLIFDNEVTSAIKTVNFVASESALHAALQRLEGYVRQQISTLEEEARFDGQEQRFTLGLSVAPLEEDS